MLEATPYSTMTIYLAVPAYNDGSWGADTPDEAVPLIARNYAALAEAYARQEFPGARIEVETKAVPGLRSWAEDAASDSVYEADDPQGPVWEITEYLSRHWTEEPLWGPQFDAAAYLAEHPR